MEYHYYAFISYQRKDEKWAKWLQNKLEHYHFPTNLNGFTDLPKSIDPTFRDVTDLTPGVLPEEIDKALRNSQWLIVVCSPNSAKSQWVGKEAQAFIDQGRSDHIIPFIIKGTPFSNNLETECFPQALLTLADSQRELLAANINELGGRDAALIKVISRMFSLRFDDLWKRREREKRRNRILLLALFLLLFIAGFGIIHYVSRQRQTAEYEKEARLFQTLYNNYLKCEKQFNNHNYAVSFRESQRILRETNNIPDTLFSNFEYLLRMSYDAIMSDTLEVINRYKAEFSSDYYGSMPIVFSDDGDTVYVGAQGFYILDVKTGKRIASAEFTPEDFRVLDDRIITFDSFSVDMYDKKTLNLLSSVSIHDSYKFCDNYITSSADGKRFLFMMDDELYVFDSYTGALLNTFKGDYLKMGSLNYDGSVIALIQNESCGLFTVETGEPIIMENVNNLHVSDLKFDRSGKWLLLYMEDNDAVSILNIDTQDVFSIDKLYESWENSFNYSQIESEHNFIVSDDNAYIAIGPSIYRMMDGSLFKRLCDPEEAMGLKIYPEARKVIQVNLGNEIVVYSRSGQSRFSRVDIDQNEINDDTIYNFMTTDLDVDGTLSIKALPSERIVGVIKGIEGTPIEWYSSISSDEKYILISFPWNEVRLYYLPTGQLIQAFKFKQDEYGFDRQAGTIGEDGSLYFSSSHGVFKYDFLPIENLLKIYI